MIDSKGRKFLDPAINKTADLLITFNLTANQVSWLAFIFGFLAAVLVYFNVLLLGVIFLWFSGFLDSVDGAIARKNDNASAWGTVLDITFDRIVEVVMVIALALNYPAANFAMILLLGSIILSMTVFLTVGSVSKRKGIKSFYYQAGFAERTEGFIFLTLMILFPSQLLIITLLFAAAITFTAGQRLMEAKRILNKI
ncbi:CDP-alcohol phosphatidyltransferase family protein [Halanaerobium sp. Z-7514]|uniref:CDP-alcohol phosphatidyltransferase family protein n=1 Tax=Halanaerobium polyolivorans TaxID=2886943 RepID=A0AAW4WXK3_9FIRM|nr:CDP-alcohol phosphatidyltransferase family protein [Halanaerobium polyolivorans]MCC3144648.1 CDP-alcohol phosphatidyltransferase family protein [Halanaerobium polyolivorans]RQD79204.1 MAG: CDP-alcohol phosphatidyltransferase family protein [Halanaerobium sp. MSAO_Bac5]